MEGEWQKQDLSWCKVFIFILCQAALDHALACQNGFGGWLGCDRGTLVCRNTHLPATPLLGMSHKDLLGAWLLPSCCSSVSPWVPWLSTYRHRLLLLHLILLLVPDAASYLSDNETWISPLCACCHVLRIRVSAGAKAAAKLVQPAKFPQTPLPVPSICSSDWATFLLQAPLLWLQLPPSLASLPIPRQMHLTLLLSFPPVHAHMSAVPDSEENIWLQQCS